MPAEYKSFPLLYRALIRPIREADYEDGNEFLRRFYIGIQNNFNTIADMIASVWDVHDPEKCPSDLLKYLKDIVGWDADFDYITDGLTVGDLRKLIQLAIPFWKERFSEVGIINAIRLLTGRSAVLYNWFYFRAVLGEVFLSEEQQGYDFWLIGGGVTYFDEFHSQVRLMENGSLDRRLVLDLVGLERVSSERIEVAVVDFLDQFDLDRSKWSTLAGTAASIDTTNKVFSIPSGTDEKALMASDTHDNYVVLHRFKLGTGSVLYTRFYVTTWSPADLYEVEVKLDNVKLTRYVGGTPTVVANVSIPPLGWRLLEGLWYKLRTSCVREGSNNRIKVYIDGNLVVSVADPPGPTLGFVAIGARTAALEVDNVEVFRVPLRLAEIGPSGETLSANFFVA
jgi:phage tail-like protein